MVFENVHVYDGVKCACSRKPSWTPPPCIVHLELVEEPEPRVAGRGEVQGGGRRQGGAQTPLAEAELIVGVAVSGAPLVLG